mmetsp:Transcript_7419/g.9877  ORF Transcript_7419/g.9877 Transcript_7419/m.9877 type:complete len:90 (+) Transcript_7419:380-649(+)
MLDRVLVGSIGSDRAFVEAFPDFFVTVLAFVDLDDLSTNGTVLGIKDGMVVGSNDGTKLGIKDGIELGLIDGMELGINDGLVLGSNVGI